jgi:hypothetical protein
VLVFAQLSGLNSSRFAHTERIANSDSTVATTITPLMSHRLPRVIGPRAGVVAVLPSGVAGVADSGIVDWSSLIGGRSSAGAPGRASPEWDERPVLP